MEQQPIRVVATADGIDVREKDMYAVAAQIANASFDPASVEVMTPDDIEDIGRDEGDNGPSGLSDEWNAMWERKRHHGMHRDGTRDNVESGVGSLFEHGESGLPPAVGTGWDKNPGGGQASSDALPTPPVVAS